MRQLLDSSCSYEDFPFNLLMFDASKLQYIYLCDGLVIKIFLQLLNNAWK